jgi:hypothetical protein
VSGGTNVVAAAVLIAARTATLMRLQQHWQQVHVWCSCADPAACECCSVLVRSWYVHQRRYVMVLATRYYLVALLAKFDCVAR